jgi:hypothetical protein
MQIHVLIYFLKNSSIQDFKLSPNLLLILSKDINLNGKNPLILWRPPLLVNKKTNGNMK